MWLLFLFSLISLNDCKLFSVFDEDIYRTSPELIESRAFRSQTHTVVTEDGYVLTIFRIINPYVSAKTLSQRKPVIIWHGIVLNSDSWLLSRPGSLNTNGVYSEDNNSVINNCNNSFTSTMAFTLAACGYDVWLGNTRGNRYSNRHLYLDNQSPEYNDYTLTELSIYDKPAVINYIMKLTQQDSVSYIGHSMGNTAMLILLALQPDYERHINPFIALSPETYVGNIRSLSVFVTIYEPLLSVLKLPIGITTEMSETLGAGICGNPLLQSLCIEFAFSIFGRDWRNTDKKRFPIYLSHAFDALSARVFAHFTQLYNTNEFQEFDYPTAEENYSKYKRITSPHYPIHAIKSRNMAFIQGLNDFTSDFQDINRFTNSLKVPLLVNYTIPYKLWNHIDFIWGIDANIYLNPVILEILNSSNKKIEKYI